MGSNRRTIVAGDVGGTHTRLGAFTVDGGPPRLDGFAEYASRNYPGLGEIVAEFLKTLPNKPAAFCFGVAGPVLEGQAHPTNLGWVIDQATLARQLGAPVVLINDLEANAYGIAALGPEDLATLQEGRMEKGNACVVSAGTGLGEAGLFWDGKAHHPFASEGGHSTFSPRTREEVALLEYLMAKFPEHVSWERVLSGPGLVNVYRFLRDTGQGAEPVWLTEAMSHGDASAAIAHAAIHGRSELCERALDMFISLYGSEAGNMALKTMAVAGVYIGGGIAPRILGKLKEGPFLKAFRDKGRMRPTMELIPVRVIINDKTALLGAALRGALAQPD